MGIDRFFGYGLVSRSGTKVGGAVGVFIDIDESVMLDLHASYRSSWTHRNYLGFEAPELGPKEAYFLDRVRYLSSWQPT